jgi:hypothetical protein
LSGRNIIFSRLARLCKFDTDQRFDQTFYTAFHNVTILIAAAFYNIPGCSPENNLCVIPVVPGMLACMHWISLTLFSAFFLATADTLSKRYLSHYRPGELVLVRFGVSGVATLAAAGTGLLGLDGRLPAAGVAGHVAVHASDS